MSTIDTSKNYYIKTTYNNVEYYWVDNGNMVGLNSKSDIEEFNYDKQDIKFINNEGIIYLLQTADNRYCAYDTPYLRKIEDYSADKNNTYFHILESSNEPGSYQFTLNVQSLTNPIHLTIENNISGVPVFSQDTIYDQYVWQLEEVDAPSPVPTGSPIPTVSPIPGITIYTQAAYNKLHPTN